MKENKKEKKFPLFLSAHLNSCCEKFRNKIREGFFFFEISTPGRVWLALNGFLFHCSLWTFSFLFFVLRVKACPKKDLLIFFSYKVLLVSVVGCCSALCVHEMILCSLHNKTNETKKKNSFDSICL